MGPVEAEPRDRAVDDGSGDVVGPDAEPGGYTWPEALEDDVGSGAKSTSECRVLPQIAHDRLGTAAQRRVPGGRCLPHRVAARRLDPDGAGAEPEELPARVRAREVAREIDDENAGERLHDGGAYLYPRRVD